MSEETTPEVKIHHRKQHAVFARPYGPDGEPVGPMRRVGRTSEFKVRVDPGARDQWEKVEKIVTRPNPYLPGLRPARFTSEYTFTIKPGDEARVMSLFHGGPRWLWEVRLAWGRCTAPPISRGTAWRDGAYAACQHQLTGPPVIDARALWPAKPCYPRWYIDLLVMNIRRAHAEHPELFDPRSWLTNAPEVNTTIRQLAEQRPDALRLYDRDWNIATEPGAAVHALPRTVARDYPPPAEPCAECVRMADPWGHVGLVAGLRIDHDELFGPRTDFMPRYPNRGHQ